MAIFEDVKLEWKGEQCVIPSTRVLVTIAQVEEVITLAELSRTVGKGKPPMAKLCMALAVMLKAAGVQVTDDEVYNELFVDGGKEMPRRAMDAVVALNMLMIPPEHLRAKPDGKKPRSAAKDPGEPSRSSTSSA